MKFLADHRHGLALFGCLALATTLRFVALDGENTWQDEAVAFRTMKLDGPSTVIDSIIITDATRALLHPLIIQELFRVFGKTMFVGRAFSAVCGVAVVFVVYLLGRRLFDRTTALWACGLAALNPLAIHHSRELRMYEFLVLLTCACWALLFSFRRGSGWGKHAVYTLCLAAVCYTHPLGGLMVIALAFGYLILRAEIQLSWISWISIHLALALILSPWVLRYFDHGPQEFPRPLTIRLILEWPEGFTGGNAEAAWVGAALVIAGIFASRRQVFKEGKLGRLPIDRTSAALLAWFLVPPLLLLAYTLTRHPIFGERRYLLFVGPAYLLLVARGLSTLPTRLRVTLMMAFLFFNVQALDRRVFNIGRPDLRTAARLAETYDRNAPVVVVGDNRRRFFVCFQTYRDPSLPAPVIPVHEWLAAQKVPGFDPGPAVWFAIERRKGTPRKPLPPDLARLYVTEQTYELPYLTLTYNRPIRTASTGQPTRR